MKDSIGKLRDLHQRQVKRRVVDKEATIKQLMEEMKTPKPSDVREGRTLH